MAHNARCSHAKSPPKDCKCSCGGLLHGGGGQISLGAGPWGRTADYNHHHRDTHLADSLDGQVVSVIDRILSSPDGDHADAATDRVAAEIPGVLGTRTSIKFQKELRKDHTICSFMVAMVQAMTKLHEAAPQAGRELAERVVKEIAERWPEGVLGQLDAESAGKLAKIGIGKLQDATTLGSLPVYIEACRYIAVASCPNPAAHDDVIKYCAEPLIEGKISEEARELLKEVTEHWYANRYSGEQWRTGNASKRGPDVTS
jgi:hypothetical protein